APDRRRYPAAGSMARPPRHRALARRCSNGPGRRCRVRGESAGYRLSDPRSRCEGGGCVGAARNGPVPSSGRTPMRGVPSGAPTMAKRKWNVDWRAQPKSDGLERLGQAVKLAIDRGDVTPEVRSKKNEATPRLILHAAAALEELES